MSFMSEAGSRVDVIPSVRRLADLSVTVGTEVKPGESKFTPVWLAGLGDPGKTPVKGLTQAREPRPL